MNNEALIGRVHRSVSSGIGPDEIIEELNEGMQQVAARVLFPELISVAQIVVTTGAQSQLLPSDFQRELFSCKDTDNKEVKVFCSRSQMLSEFNGMTGGAESRIVGVAVEGRSLVVYPSPTEEIELSVWYYRKPDEIKCDQEEVVVPAEFRKVLFHYALFSIYDEIENGEEGEKVNTNRHEIKYEQYISMLKLRFREGVSRRKVPIVKGEFL